MMVVTKTPRTQTNVERHLRDTNLKLSKIILLSSSRGFGLCVFLVFAVLNMYVPHVSILS